MARSGSSMTIIFAGALVGCMNGGSNAGSGSKATVSGPTPAEVVAGQVSAALTRATSCDDLLSRIRDDVSAKIVLEAELMKQGDQNMNGGVGIGGSVQTGNAFGNPSVKTPQSTNGATDSAKASAPSSAPGIAGTGTAATPSNSGQAMGSSTPSTGTAPPSQPAPNTNPSGSVANFAPTGHSDTNVQVAGVDEADIVKTDGMHIYLLHGNQLFVLKSWPAKETAIEGKISIEGGATEMFVDKETAVVFSSVNDQGDLIAAPPPAQDGSTSPAQQYLGSPFTKITLVDVSGATPQVTRELFLEGSYLSARRYDKTVRAVIQGGFRTPPIYAGNIDYQDPWGRKYPQEQIDEQVNAWRDRMIAAITSTKLDDWLPTERELVDGKLSAPTRRCTDFYAPPPGLTDYGLTNIVSFDMHDAKSALGGAIVLGAADEVYSNDSVMLLAHRDYRWDLGLIERERTVLHRFALKGAGTSYSASGFVPGHILDQFSLDEAGGVVRVSTTAQMWENFRAPIPALAMAATKEDNLPSGSGGVETLRRQTDNRVATLRVSGDKLVRAGITEPLGNDGETLKSTRFVGDRGYVVTFHQTDPLMIIDLSKPESLVKLGELDIPGFSDYMHPIDNDNLLTIGRDTDPTTGQDRGLLLQLFDVSDATHPRRTHTRAFGPNGYSEANMNHKAFTFYKPDGAVGYDGLLAFPYVNYTSTFQSVLEVFQVSVQDGFMPLGAIDHTQVLQTVCGYAPGGINPGFVGGGVPYFNQCVQPEVRRGLFIVGDTGEFVYSISNGGVLAHSLSDLTTPVATVQLPLPDYSDHRICYGTAQTCAQFGGSVGFASSGSAGVGTAMTLPVSTSVTPPQPAQPPAADAGVPMGSAGAGK